MAYATVADVESRFRELDEEEAAIVETRLGDAELILKTRIPDLDDKVTDSDVYHDLVVMIEAEAVLRLMRNPDGYKSETDGNYSYEIDIRVASGRLDILADEWALLGVQRGVYTIRPRFDMPVQCPPDPWVTM